MIEMSSGIGATTMGLGVSHGGSGNVGGSTGSGGGGNDTTGGGCRLRAQSQSQGSTGSPSQQHRGSNNSGQPQQQRTEQAGQQRHGLMGRSKKDNCCLCWCCCCSCSCLAAVGGSGGTTSMRPGAGGMMGGGQHGSGLGLAGDMSSGSGNGLEGDINDISIDEIRAWGSSFDRLMRNPVGRRLFKEFLVSEYSDENISFWLACEQLKRESNPEKIEEKARFIYEDYISIISPKEVSLDSQVREVVNRNMSCPTPHTFDEAQLQIYTLMHRDSYPRFVNSDLYQRVARINSGPPSPCIESSGEKGAPSATSTSHSRKSKKSIS